MPNPVAEPVEAPAVVTRAQPTLFVEVRDIADLGQRQPPLATLGGGPADLELAEFAGKIAQLLVAEALFTKHQHGVTVDRLPQRLHTRPVDRPGEIHPADFADK